MTPPTDRRRVGLLGGTFDPPHVAHLVVAEEARVALALDEVRFVVAGDPYTKSGVSAAHHRVAMTRLATAGNPGFAVDDREARRAGPSYTVDTLRELTAWQPTWDWFFLAGTDAIASLSTWREPEEVLRLATVVAMSRPGSVDGPSQVASDAAVQHLEVPGLDVSSTALRARFRTGRAVRYLVPDAVVDYVVDAGLYRRQG